MRDLVDIRYDLEEMSNMSCKPNWTRPRENEVIDEDKSVKWNREEVIRLRDKYDTEVKELNAIKNKRRDELYKETYKVIRHDVKGITIEDAKEIFDYAYREWHSYGYVEVFNHMEELVELISDIVNHKNDGNV